MVTIEAKRATFRALHENGFFILPNAWDVGGALRLAGLGFRAIGSTSSGAAMAIGKEDGAMSRDEVLAHLRMLVAATDLPVNADFENGFADDPAGVAANVALAVATGVAAISIEDWSGTRIYDKALAVERIAAARAALDGRDVLLIGRHEHFRVPQTSVAEAIDRAAAYAQAGANVLFVPFLIDKLAVAELVAAVAPKPVSVVVQRYDSTIRDLADIGVRRCSVGGGLAKTMWSAFVEAARTLKSYDGPG